MSPKMSLHSLHQIKTSVPITRFKPSGIEQSTIRRRLQ
jgi:hypothetical protein